jgi:TRAP-type C4-dicarboxylate transport system substrate-binding protein
MNQKSWNHTPPDLQKIITEVAGNPFSTTGGLDHHVYGQLIDDIKAKGVTIYTLPAEESSRWSKQFQEVTRQWVADMEKKGKPAREAVLMYNKIADEKGVPCPAFPQEWK